MSAGVSTNWDMEREKLQLEREKLQLEREKLQLQREVEEAKVEAQLEIEKKKLKVERWKLPSVAAPIIIAILAGGFALWEQNRQVEHQFAVKAAEIIMSTNDVDEMAGRASILSTLFPEDLKKVIDTRTDILKFSKENQDPRNEQKKELLKLLVDNKDQKQRQDIVHFWKQIYPDQEWANSVTIP